MRSLLCGVVFLALAVVPCLNVFAQSAEMPVPLAVVKDADGKVMVQVADFGEGPDYLPRVLFSFEGTPAVFAVHPTNGVFLIPLEIPHWIAFEDFDCTGDAGIWTYIPSSSGYGLEAFTQKTFVIMGPHPDLGTYRVFRSTSTSKIDFEMMSEWRPETGCTNRTSPSFPSCLPAEEILPNPLEGFHGPTVAKPLLVLTIEGGTRFP